MKLGHLVQEQAAVGDQAQLAGRQGRHDEPVADVDVELVPRPPPGPMTVQPGPQAHRRGALASRSDEVLALGTTAAHPGVDELPSPPHRVHARRAARHTLIRPVSERQYRPGLQLIHGDDPTDPQTQTNASQRRQAGGG
jgi:hypothetical protein